jgi:Kdo2-lipid IVA lauroyltransferase/acyltransferase
MCTMKRCGHWITYALVRVLICVVQSVRIETCARWAQFLAIFANDVVGIRRRVIDDNLLVVFPEMSRAQRRRLARRMWEHLILMTFEIAHVPRRVHETNWRQFVRIRGMREVCRCLLEPRPTVMVSGHFGNFEVAGYTAGLLGFPTFSVARPLDNPYLDRFVNAFRVRTGQHILPKHGSAEIAARVLECGGLLGLLGDQHAGAKGCWVNFFGRPASCHKAIAIFALTSKAPLLVVYAKRLGRPLQFEVGLAAAVDPACGGDATSGVSELTQWYNDQLERVIRDTPQQYWWLHRRWKGTPPAAVARRLSSAASARSAA